MKIETQGYTMKTPNGAILISLARPTKADLIEHLRMMASYGIYDSYRKLLKQGYKAVEVTITIEER